MRELPGILQIRSYQQDLTNLYRFKTGAFETHSGASEIQSPFLPSPLPLGWERIKGEGDAFSRPCEERSDAAISKQCYLIKRDLD